jgi:hypothetical protein
VSIYNSDEKLNRLLKIAAEALGLKAHYVGTPDSLEVFHIFVRRKRQRKRTIVDAFS